MKTYIDKCCDQCWHSLDNPCDLFIVCSLEGPLCHQDEKCKEKHQTLHNNLKYKNNEVPVIFIGMGTCGLASGADKVKTAIENELKAKNIVTEIIPTGCIGLNHTTGKLKLILVTNMEQHLQFTYQ
jgi:NADH-quinone oxidoreductase subunit F